MTNHSEARIRELIAEMRTIEMVAGQCAIETTYGTEARLHAEEAKQCRKWADALEALLVRAALQGEPQRQTPEAIRREVRDHLRVAQASVNAHGTVMGAHRIFKQCEDALVALIQSARLAHETPANPIPFLTGQKDLPSDAAAILYANLPDLYDTDAPSKPNEGAPEPVSGHPMSLVMFTCQRCGGGNVISVPLPPSTPGKTR